MRRSLCAAGGLVAACAAAYCLVIAGSIAGPAIYDVNTIARQAKDSLKADRLPLAPQAAPDGVVMAFPVPSKGMTVVARGQIKGQALPREDAMQAPRKDELRGDRLVKSAKQQTRLPEGCEPSFSPVTVPALANVPGRCLS